jgi:hypothetical protein
MKKEKNEYWDLSILEPKDDIIDDLIFGIKGKIKIDLHKHSCMNMKYPKFKVAEYYYIDLGYDTTDYYLCQISYLRNGVVFYKTEKDNYSQEHHFDEFSIMHYFAEPKELTIKADPERYEILSRSGKMNVIYQK